MGIKRRNGDEIKDVKTNKHESKKERNYER